MKPDNKNNKVSQTSKQHVWQPMADTSEAY